MAFVHELLNHAVGDTRGGGLAWQTLEVGQNLRLPPTIEMPAPPTLASPTGESIELRREVGPEGAGTWISAPLEEPGVYQLSTGDRGWPVAVNLPANESDLRGMTQESVTAALGDVELQWLGDELPSQSIAEEDERPDFGWSLLLAVLLLAGLECFMAMRFGRHRR